MTSTELLKKALKAWDVEISPVHIDEDFYFRRTLSYKGRELKVSWDPEANQDAVAMKGRQHEVELIAILLGHVAKCLMEIPEDELDG